MVQVHSSGLMEPNILEIGVKEEPKDVEYSSMLMEISLKVNSLTIKLTAMVSMYTKMVKDMKEPGRMICKMVMVKNS